MTLAVVQAFLALECHFVWIFYGSIWPVVQKNLIKELWYLEKYMHDLSRADVNDMNNTTHQGETMYYKSCDNMKEEGICSQSPKLVVKAWNW
jgi:hypothetical protein